MEDWYGLCAAAGMVVLLVLVSWIPALLGAWINDEMDFAPYLAYIIMLFIACYGLAT